MRRASHTPSRTTTATGRPYGQLWVMTLADGKTVRFGGEKEPSGNPDWSADGQWLAYRGRVGDKAGWWSRAPTAAARVFSPRCPAPTARCRRPARRSPGRRTASGSRSSRRCLVLKPPTPPAIRSSSRAICTSLTPARAMTRFNDNRRLHLFVVDVASGRIDQLTDGTHYEHSIDWSPNGRRDAVPLESRAERGSILQLRPVRAEGRRQVDPRA